MKSSHKFITTFLSLFLLLGLGAMSFLSAHKDLFQSLNEGIYTCFTRVGQTYTSKLLGHQNSPYLQNDFIKTTQECFAESIDLVQGVSLFPSTKIKQALNNLASEVHWLHQSMNPAEGVANKFKGTQDDSISLNSRFAALEKLRDTVVDQVDMRIETVSTFQTASVILTFSLAIFIIFSLVSREKSNATTTIATRKARGQELLISDEAPLFNPLFTPFRAKSDILDEAVPVAESTTAGELSAPNQNSQINLNETFTNILNYMSPELEAKNLHVSFETKDKTFLVKSSADTIEHIFFTTLICITKLNLGNRDGHSEIKIQNRLLGEKLSLRIIASKKNDQVDNSDISKDFKILRELTADEGLQFIFEEDGDQFVFAFIFNNVTVIDSIDQSRRLSLLKKGKKRDLAREFQN